MKPEPRPLYFWLSFIALIMGMAINGVFGYLNYAERREMRTEQQMTRTMLNARAKIQIKLVAALSEGRALTNAELTEINRLWMAAEYQFVENGK